MITAIRPYTPQVRQNQPNFQRKFESKELKNIVKGYAEDINDLQVGIAAGIIRAKDGAGEQIEKLLQENPDNDYVNYIVNIFYKYNPRQ